MVRARQQQQQREEEDAERQAAAAAAAAPQLQRPPLRIIYDGKEQQQQRKRQQPQQLGDGSPEGSGDNPTTSNGASGSGLSPDGSIDVEVTSDEGSSSDSEEISVLLSQQQARARQLQLEREQGMQDPQDPQPQPPQQPPSFQQQQGDGGLGSSGLQDNVAEDSAALAEQIEALREDFEAGRKPSKDQLNEIGERLLCTLPWLPALGGALVGWLDGRPGLRRMFRCRCVVVVALRSCSAACALLSVPLTDLPCPCLPYSAMLQLAALWAWPSPRASAQLTPPGRRWQTAGPSRGAPPTPACSCRSSSRQTPSQVGGWKCWWVGGRAGQGRLCRVCRRPQPMCCPLNSTAKCAR